MCQGFALLTGLAGETATSQSRGFQSATVRERRPGGIRLATAAVLTAKIVSLDRSKPPDHLVGDFGIVPEEVPVDHRQLGSVLGLLHPIEPCSARNPWNVSQAPQGRRR